MKKLLAVLCILVLSLSVACMAQADVSGSTRIARFVHNVTVSGKMAPDTFDPDVTSYLLSTGSTVNNVYFTITLEDPNATMYIDGKRVQSGVKTQVAGMSDNPKAVYIDIYGVYGGFTRYTIFLQRRPSDKRTRVSSGYITKMSAKDGVTSITADLVNVYYNGGNDSTFHNDSAALYTYPCSANCIFYYGTIEDPHRCHNATEFNWYYTQTPDQLYRIVYIEDEIVAVLPYAADYEYSK
ncbi:MAG: hypothetical protein CW338_02715 [Clostridiales bacterium]|nr:hypothetical protein [Clostridiales bacterium]